MFIGAHPGPARGGNPPGPPLLLPPSAAQEHRLRRSSDAAVSAHWPGAYRRLGGGCAQGPAGCAYRRLGHIPQCRGVCRADRRRAPKGPSDGISTGEIPSTSPAADRRQVETDQVQTEIEDLF